MSTSDEHDRDRLCEAISAAMVVADQQGNFLVGALLSQARDAAECASLLPADRLATVKVEG